MKIEFGFKFKLNKFASKKNGSDQIIQSHQNFKSGMSIQNTKFRKSFKGSLAVWAAVVAQQ